MKQITKLIVWGLGVLCITVGAYYLLMSMGLRSEAPLAEFDRLPESTSSSPEDLSRQSPVVASPLRKITTGPSSTPSVQALSPSSVLPVVQPAPPLSIPPQPKGREGQISELQKKLKQIQSSLLQMVQQPPGTIDIQKLDVLLNELGQIKDKTGLTGGVDIDALRQNLAVTGKIQALSIEIQEEANKPQDQLNIAKLKSDTQKLLELQTKMLPINFNMPSTPEQ
ncbi:MAG: hypothetical protein M0O96_10130 [Desulforhopalus sp.]|nr:hypothetical protein [Desulforhopalus sp.]